LIITNRRSRALNALSSPPTGRSFIAGVNVPRSSVATTGSDASVLMYCASRPKLKIHVSLIVTVPPPLPEGQILVTRSCTRLWSTLPLQARI